jgi:hypothetical protein
MELQTQEVMEQLLIRVVMQPVAVVVVPVEQVVQHQIMQQEMAVQALPFRFRAAVYFMAVVVVVEPLIILAAEFQALF